MTHIIFGSENAETDALLYDCFVSFAGPVADKPILTGRWGTGKTALILYSNKALSDALNSQGADDRLWYLDESSLNRDALKELKARISNTQSLTTTFEDLWRAEILRIETLVLAALWHYYGSPDSEHWRTVRKVAGHDALALPLWKQLGNIARIIFGNGSNRLEGVEGVKGAIDALFGETLFKSVQQCLEDIKVNPVQPVVAVEPIETPTSAIEEEKGLAQPLITALVNVFRDTFEPSPRQMIKLRLSIPWHRFVKDDLDFPQKLYQYVTPVSWTSGRLREFINRRIEWEFKNIGRAYTQKGTGDAWTALFDEHVVNDHCSPQFKEDSFNYILRHTHHRARDIQRFARDAFMYQLRSREGISEDDLLHGRGGRKIAERTVREAVRRTAGATGEERITEAGRRFPSVRVLADCLRGLRVPFALDDFKKRLENLGDKHQYPVRATLDTLWRAGIIGVEMTPLNPEGGKHLALALGTRAIRRYEAGGISIEKRFFFEYNWDGDPWELLDRESLGEIKTELVVHPMTYEYLYPKVTRDYPIGA